MDPTTQIKALFGDLLMQIAILQSELELTKKQLAEKAHETTSNSPASGHPVA
jgi:uncharacterized small protein (DUF1192 family)